AARLVGAVPRGETLTVRVHPDLRLEDWRPGTFRLVDSTTAADPGPVVTVPSGLTRSQAGPPPARPRPPRPASPGHERLWWQVDPGRMTLAANLALDVTRGPVFQVPLRLPTGWEVERVETDPADLLASWSVRPGKPAADPDTLVVEFLHPLKTGTG